MEQDILPAHAGLDVAGRAILAHADTMAVAPCLEDPDTVFTVFDDLEFRRQKIVAVFVEFSAIYRFTADLNGNTISVAVEHRILG